MDAARRQIVRERADDLCEYCRIHEDDDPFYRFHVEHIVARVHGGSSELDNLCWSCHHCNVHKGTNLVSMDPDVRIHVRLFNPRNDAWDEHFALADALVVGISEIGQTTVRLLQMNAPRRVQLRQEVSDA